MCFHFPVMPMLYYALREEKAANQIIDDPRRHARRSRRGTQWGTFLRNHDELTLEMVTTGAARRRCTAGTHPDPRMRANVGIRRRLSPLLDNSRPEIELDRTRCCSRCPARPCLYYGDEIGMGDNIWLHDRDAVRTPMQWTPDRNSGFSTADPGQLYLPVNQSLVSHYGHVNVEAQLAQPTSLLHWIHGMLTVRRQHPSLGRGEFEVVPSASEAVLTFLRTSPEETLLVVANLAATPRSTTVTLDGHGGAALHDVFGGAQFPDVRPDGTVQFTLGSREFYWLTITPGGASSTATGA